jgi:hypothetical protein
MIGTPGLCAFASFEPAIHRHEISVFAQAVGDHARFDEGFGACAPWACVMTKVLPEDAARRLAVSRQ